MPVKTESTDSNMLQKWLPPTTETRPTQSKCHGSQHKMYSTVDHSGLLNNADYEGVLKIDNNHKMETTDNE